MRHLCAKRKSGRRIAVFPCRLGAMRTFCLLNGRDLVFTVDDAEELVQSLPGMAGVYG